MKKYVKPEARIIALDGNDVITASNGNSDVIFNGSSTERHAFLDWNLMDWSKDWPDDMTKGFKG